MEARRPFQNLQFTDDSKFTYWVIRYHHYLLRIYLPGAAEKFFKYFQL